MPPLRILLISLVPSAILLGSALACATHYQSSGFTGGYSDQQIDSNTFRVSFRGNGYTSADKTQNYLLRRCAEVTKGAGFDYFVIVDGGTGVSTSYNVNTYRSPYGHSSSTVQPIHKASSTALIKVFRGAKPEADPNAYDAADVLAHIPAD